MYQLENPIYFYALLSIPLVVLLYVAMVVWQRQARARFGDDVLIKKLSPELSPRKPVVKLLLYSLALLFLSIALVNPKIGTKLETVQRKGVDVVFAIDVSKSMLAEDLKPSRLKKAKQLLSKVIDQLANDRIGIIVYAGKAYPQLPITTDYAAAKMFLKTIHTDIVPTQGTAIGEAIELSRQFYDQEDQKNKVLFIISDGENHEEGSMKAATEALKEGVKIYTIGVGLSKGGPIPEKRGGYVVGYKKDRQGNVVVTRLDEQNLREIAKAGNGEYINGTNTNAVVRFVQETLDSMEKTEFEAKVFSDYKDQFQWFLGIALFFLVLDLFIFERKTRWLKKLNLFGE